MKICKFGHEREHMQIQCLECKKEGQRVYRVKNKEKDAAYREARKEYKKGYNKAYCEINAKKIAETKRAYGEANKEKIAKTQRAYQAANIERRRSYCRDYEANRLATDPLFKLVHYTRSLIRGCFRRKGWKKSSKTQEVLGCDFATLDSHLTITALNNYGFWSEYESYHIDHIVPISTAKNEQELIALNRYTNLQYLYPQDNLKKSDRLDWGLT